MEGVVRVVGSTAHRASSFLDQAGPEGQLGSLGSTQASLCWGHPEGLALCWCLGWICHCSSHGVSDHILPGQVGVPVPVGGERQLCCLAPRGLGTGLALRALQSSLLSSSHPFCVRLLALCKEETRKSKDVQKLLSSIAV